MLTSLISSLVILSGAGLVSAASSPTFAVANLIPGPMGPLSGSVLFTSAGEGVTVSLLISGFPPESGPWPYHIHQYPVTGNNCSTSGPPFALANETNIPVPCLPDAVPNGCRAGDMAGRFGNLSSLTTEMTASYYDPYISLDPAAPNYVGNLSFNVHWANFSVIACCNLEMMGPAVTMGASSSVCASSTVVARSGLPLFTSGAAAKTVGTMLVGVATGLAALYEAA